MSSERGDTLRRILDETLRRLDAAAAVREAPWEGEGPTAILAVGKASGAMLRGARARFGDDAPALLVAPRGAKVGSRSTKRMRAGHPFADEGSRRAARRARSMLRSLKREDHLLVLLSGGASALLSLPPHGLPLAHKNDLLRRVMAAGCDITELNLLRRHLSRVKGGRMARYAAPARVTVWLLSDVVDPRGLPIEAQVGSGPFAADPSSVEDAQAMLARLELEGHPAAKRLEESVSALDNVEHHVLLDNAAAIETAATVAGGFGDFVTTSPTPLTGSVEAAVPGLVDLATALAPGCWHIAGGELTVAHPADAPPGGRNQHLALALALAFETQGLNKSVLCAGTDGRDGTTEAMGACVDGESAARIRAAGLDPQACLAEHRAHEALTAAGVLLPRRNTGSNLADLVLIHG